MTTTLIVLAHPEPRSFNAAWAQASAKAAQALGHEVIWSDLCATGFDPVESPAHYVGRDGETPFDVLKAQEEVSAQDALPYDVALEVVKVRRADRIIFHFPIWWFAPPAILKGWCERALAHGALHSVDARFDTGLCRRKQALFCVTTGSREAESAYNGKEGDIQMLLWPLAYTLRYLGMTVLRPEILHGVHGYNRGERRLAMEARLRAALDAQPTLIEGLERREVLAFNSDDEFDKDGRLRPGAASHSPFIRHTP